MMRSPALRALSNWLSTHKPAAPARVHLALAAALWSIVGAALLVAGGRWIALGGRGPVVCGAALAMAMAVGAAKARLVLYSTARRMAARIQCRGDGQCLGGFLSWKSWALVAAMAASGRLLRTTSLPVDLLGFLYAMVGTALILGSRVLWRERRCGAGGA